MEGSTNFIEDRGSKSRRRRGESKVVDLSCKEDHGTINVGNVEIALMLGIFESNSFQNASDMFVPKASRFRMTLKGMLNWQDVIAINRLVEALFIPFGKGIVDAEISWNTGSRGVCKSVAGVAGINCIK